MFSEVQPASSSAGPGTIGRGVTQPELQRLGELQASHYDKIAEGYEAHYSDRWGLEYRARFVSGPMTEGLPLPGLKVLDAMCGSGQLTGYLVEQGALVTGLDISPAVIEQFRQKHPTAEGLIGSIFDTGLPSESFDVVAVSIALHHAQPNIQAAIDEIHRILRPGGWLVFTEPHAGSVMDLLRRLWYRFDPLFEANEQSVDVEALERDNAGRFEFVSKRYGGNVAYLLVYNSMVFRVPHSLKRLYAGPLMALEALLQRVQTRRTSCMVNVQWRKRPDPGRAQPS